jgi:hypothetical protein
MRNPKKRGEGLDFCQNKAVFVGCNIHVDAVERRVYSMQLSYIEML